MSRGGRGPVEQWAEHIAVSTSILAGAAGSRRAPRTRCWSSTSTMLVERDSLSTLLLGATAVAAVIDDLLTAGLQQLQSCRAQFVGMIATCFREQ